MTDRIVVAYSGGLDTSWCVAHLAEHAEVVTVLVDVGGHDSAELETVAARARSLGATRHIVVDAREAFFDEILRYLIAGNVLRGQCYPLCVGAERTLQAREVARVAREVGASAVAHGCTAAGNDQVRFEVALRALAPELRVLAPVRDREPSRAEELADVARHGVELPAQAGDYSVNQGLWGTTIGGRETLGSEQGLPEEAWCLTRGAFAEARAPRTLRVGFAEGVPVSLDGESLPPVTLIEQLAERAASYGIGRGIHVGDTVLGIKGRVAFEAPAATVLITAHRELEKLTLSAAQLALKEQLSHTYGMLVHEGQWLEAAARDIETFFTSTQRTVNGTVALTLRTGHCFVDGVTSDDSLLGRGGARYGEQAAGWSGADAAGFARLAGLAVATQAARAREPGAS